MLTLLRRGPPLQTPISTPHLHTQTPSPPPSQNTSLLASLILQSDPTSLPRILHDPTHHWTPLSVNQILKLLWNHGPKALLFFKTLDRHPTYTHSAASYNHAVDIAARLNDHKSLWAFVARMKSLRVGPNPTTFSIIAERYVAAGKPDRAVKVFLSMHEHGCYQDLNSFNTVLDILCKARRVEKAYNLFKVFRAKFRADCVSYNIIANGWCLVKRTPKAAELLAEMVERGIEPSLVTYNIMLKGYLRAGQVKEAWKFFLEMKKRKLEIDVFTYTTLVHGFGVLGEVKKARKIFDGMVEEGVLPSVATYTALIQVLCKKDSVENAMVVFKEMEGKGYVPNVTTYNVLVRGLCHAGLMDKGMELMERMKGDECEPNVQTYNVVVRYYCDGGEIDKALSVFEKMGKGECLPNLDTYNVLISAMFVRKKPEDLLVAGKLLIEMVDRGFLPRKYTFNRVMDGLLLTGNQGFAKEILRSQSKCGRLPRQVRL